MSEGSSLLAHLPQQWVGIGVAILFTIYVVGQAVEKYEKIAKVLPLGQWWYERQKSKQKPIDMAQVAIAVEEARHQWESEGNSTLTMLEAKLQIVAAVSRQQVLDIEDLNNSLRAFRAWSGYDARWHHKHEIDNAGNPGHVTSPHKDFFEFEKVWREDPAAALAMTTNGG